MERATEPAVLVEAIQCRKAAGCDVVSHWIVDEVPVTLYFNGEQMITLMCAGFHLDELAVGFFIAEGWIKNRDRVQGIEVDTERGIVNVRYDGPGGSKDKFWLKRAITSGCAKGSVLCEVLDELLENSIRSSLKLAAEGVWKFMNELNNLSSSSKRTHGVHNCLLASPSEVIYYRYDVGRHNALDMLVGRAFLDGLSLDDKLVVTTGRLTSEVVIKAAQVGIPILISRHAVTKLAVELASSLGITIIGYTRADRFTIYSEPSRIIK